MATNETTETTSEKTTAATTSGSRKTLKEDYAKASKKDKLTKFYIDPTTKTLQRK